MAGASLCIDAYGACVGRRDIMLTSGLRKAGTRLSCHLAGQINNNNNVLSNELREKEREKIPMNLEVTV